MTTFLVSCLGLVAVVLAVLSTAPMWQFGFAMFAAGCGVAALLTMKGDA